MEALTRAPARTLAPSPRGGAGRVRGRARTPVPPAFRLQRTIGNRAVGRMIQAKLEVGRPGDACEREADRLASAVMRAPEPTLQSGAGRARGLAASAARPAEAFPGGFGGGEPLSEGLRGYFEPRFGHDFGRVRVHTGAEASEAARGLGARAFTVGSDIFFGQGEFKPGQSDGKEVLAHELTHVVQQQGGSSPVVERSSAGPRIQRRLVTFGTLADVNALLGLLGPNAGLTLALNVATNQVQINAVLGGAPPSATLRARLTAIINHVTQHAEVIVARGQPQVFVGAFPQPSDLTVTRVQQVDIDDILAVEAGAPGNGVAFAMHEIEENFQAHGVTPVAGRDRFAAAHRQAETRAENPVAAELVGPGRRVAFVTVPGGIVAGFTFGPFSVPGIISPAANTTASFFDYENYYLGVTRVFTPATQDVRITNARRFPKVVVSTRTIDNFVSGSNALPAAAAALVAAAAADVAANPTSTVLIQGFSDSVGGAAGNLRLSQRRADAARTALQGAGVGQLRIHAEGLGETSFVAPNVTAADRARNRRVVITVTRPQL